jgi:hypothetical protein
VRVAAFAVGMVIVTVPFPKKTPGLTPDRRFPSPFGGLPV